MRYLLLFLFTFLAFSASAADGETTEYFGALWDFIDWVYEAMDDIQQAILDFLIEIGKTLFLWYLEVKLSSLEFMWSIAESFINSLNITDTITSNFGGLSSDIQAFMTELRLGEAINLLLSAHITRFLLNLVGW